MINIQLLKDICQIPGAPGFENDIRKFVIDCIKPLVDEWYIDNLGNVIAIKKGRSETKVMVAAHMDEISYVVTHIDDDGFVRFHTLGGFDPKTLTAQKVIIHGKKEVMGVMGTKPIHTMTAEDRSKAPKLTDFFIDTGYSKAAVEDMIEVGNPITRLGSFDIMGDCVNSKSLDNRLSVFILIEVLKQLKDPEFTIVAAFTVQEEVGLRGAMTATSGVQPQFGLALDVTAACDTPGMAPHEFISKLGSGTAIKILDGGVISDYRMVKFLKQLAGEHQIPYQMEILTGGSTDTAALQRYGPGGAIVGAISIPTRYLHQTVEMANLGDISATIDLLAVALQEIHQYNFDHV